MNPFRIEIFDAKDIFADLIKKKHYTIIYSKRV